MPDMKDLFLQRLVAGVPKVLQTFDAATGRFMTPGYSGPDLGWAVTNQDVMYPLALLYKTRHPVNPYGGDPRILEVVSKAGDAVRAWQYPDGQVEFIKIDGSRWGPTYMCWTQYHWVEAYALVADDLDPDCRARWQEGLTLALDGSAALISKDWRLHNIPAWHGMTLVRAGQVFGRDDWAATGREMIRRVAAAQTEHGYWAEHGGPTTSYNLVYVHAIGLHHAFTGDKSVLPALQRSLGFHLTFTYPDGSMVETVDGRVKYHKGVPDRCIPAYSLFPQGRRFVRWLMEQALARGQTAACTSGMASAYQHYAAGDEAPIPQEQDRYERPMGDLAVVRRDRPWFTCLSAMTVEPDDNRWGMDRQSFVSLYHDACGLIAGGGNSKNQAAWSNFVLGAAYLPKSARLIDDGVELDYQPALCSIRVKCDATETSLVFALDSAANSAEACCQLPLRIDPHGRITTAGGRALPADGKPIRLTTLETGGGIGCNGWRLDMPPGAVFEYPVSPFNPYAKDGAAPLDQAIGVVRAPLSSSTPQQTFRIRVG